MSQNCIENKESLGCKAVRETEKQHERVQNYSLFQKQADQHRKLVFVRKNENNFSCSLAREAETTRSLSCAQIFPRNFANSLELKKY